MSSSPRISDAELAAINTAAVTQQYKVQPRIGPSAAPVRGRQPLSRSRRLSHCFCSQWVNYIALLACLNSDLLLRRPLVILDNVKVRNP